jgi:hypothetical protein
MIGLSTCSKNLSNTIRNTTNNVCKITRKDTVFTTKIRIGNNTVVVPCGLLKYLSDLEILIKHIEIKKAIELLIKKYNIPVPINPHQEIKRYIYPTANKKINYPVIKFNTSFRLGVKSDFNVRPHDSFVVGKSYVLNVCNDDTITFSTTISDMQIKATYWYNTLRYLPQCYCLIRSINKNIKYAITGNLQVDNGQIIFTTIIFNSLYIYYNEYPEDTDINIILQTPESDLSVVFIKDIFTSLHL